MITSPLSYYENQREDANIELQQQSISSQYRDYNIITLNRYNQNRCFYLPSFPYLKPTSIDKIPLLLSNVSTMILCNTGIYRRYGACYDGPFISTITSHQMDSFMNNLFKYYFVELMERLKISISLIDFNLARLQNITERFHMIRSTFYQQFIHHKSLKSNVNGLRQERLSKDFSIALNLKELSMGLEFFLQVDVDLFYMKTCSFRGAQPRSLDEGLFCKANSPSVRYCFTPCQQIICTLCESTSSIINFNCYQMHRFLNGYHTILNCPATCQTNNIIYALTCLCGEYDFIGSTSSNMAELIHCLHDYGNRFIHESLLSEISLKNFKTNPDHFLYEEKEKFRLYQHIVRCPKIIQNFLNINPHYNCFIPMNYDEAMLDNMNDTYQISSYDSTIDMSMQHVPIPPSGYTFSNAQRYQQYLFFQKQNQQMNDEKLWTNIDLYHATLIAVLPENSSTLLREVLECIFSTHAETKLNIFNLCIDDTDQFYGPPYHRIWCEGIIRPK